MSETAGGTADWTLERYREGDEAAILGLFTTVFQRSRSVEHWTWQFKDNPYGGPYVSLARRNTDRVAIGSYSVMPVRINLMGRPIPGCQSVDTAVHPEHRNQRIFENTARDCYAWCHSQKILGVIGFPNARSYPGFMRTLGWSRIAFPKRYVLRLGAGTSFGDALSRGPLAAMAHTWFRIQRRMEGALRGVSSRSADVAEARLERADAMPADYEQLWALIRSQEVLSVWKDADYLHWRYDRNPDHRFTYWTLRGAAGLLAMAVTVNLDGAWYLCEFMVRGRDAALGRKLSWGIAGRAMASGARSLVLIGHDQGFFDEALEGFHRTVAFENVYCGRAFEPGLFADLLPHAHNWTFVFGDGDFV